MLSALEFETELMILVLLFREVEPPDPCSHGHISFALASAAELAFGSDSPRLILSKAKDIDMA